MDSEVSAALDAVREGGADAFRRTYAWKHKSETIRARDRWECQDCKARGRYAPATAVHHIKPLSVSPELALTDSNLISLCNECHERRHGRGPELTPERW